MTCDFDGSSGPEFKRHLAECPSCREQSEFDSLLQKAIVAPQLSANFRRNLSASVRREKAVGWTRSLIAPDVGLATTAVCISFVPGVWQVGLALSLIAFGAPSIFEWLTEELGDS